ncbi:hypothetical protein SMX32_002363 [Cronobacter sakazakii]|nr:hypothetical protein [Cronobacter sakazakii]
MSEINGYVSDETIELILAGVIEGVQPTTQEVAMARELRALRKILDGVPQEAIDGGWTARGLSDYAKQLETELAAMRERAEPVAYRYRFRPTREAAGKWILVDTLEEANPLPKYEIQPLYTAPPAPVVADWTNDQCFEFLAVAFRHAEIKGDFELDDLRLGVKMANAMTQVKEGGCLNPQQSANLC